jgi:hypothetical protein
MKHSLYLIVLLTIYSGVVLGQNQEYTCGMDAFSSELLSITNNSCYSISNLDHNYDLNYIPPSNGSRIEISLKFIVFQKSASDPNNFSEGNPDHYNYLNGAYWTARGIFENVEQPYYAGSLNPSGFQTIDDTKIRFVREGDIEYVVDSELWNNGGNNSFCGISNTNLWIDYLNNRPDNGCVLYVLLPGMMNPGSDGCGNAYFGEDHNFIVIPAWSHYNIPQRWANWAEGRNIAHELGHALGMLHTFGGDANAFADVNYPTTDCWCNPETNTGNTDCPSPLFCSNNLMSYSAHYTEHISPLQAGHMREIAISSWRNKWIKIEKDESSDIVIESGTSISWDNARIVEKDIIVEAGAELTISCKVVFSEDTEINVEPGGRLVIDGGHLTTQHNSCGSRYFWNGIDVIGDPSIVQNQNSQAYVELKNGAIIENAKNAISTGDDGNANYSGGIVSAKNSVFRNNDRHIEFLEYTFDNTSYFEECLFIYDDEFFPNNVLPKYGVTLYKNKGVTFRDCEFSSEYDNDNYIGVYAVSSGLEIIGFNNVFSGFFTGFKCQNNSGNVLKVENTHFQNNAIGLSVSNTIGGQFNDNTFVIGGNPISRKTSGIWLNYNHGIHLLNSTGYSLSGNQFLESASFLSSADTYGVLVKNSGENYNLIDNNYFENLDIGVQCEGVNRVLGNSDEGLELYCNGFNNCYNAIVVTQPFGPIVINPEGGIAISQGRPNLSTGNTFSQSSVAILNYYYSPLINYYYDNTANSYPVNSQNIIESIGGESSCRESISISGLGSTGCCSYEELRVTIDSLLFRHESRNVQQLLSQLDSSSGNNQNSSSDYKELKHIEASLAAYENIGDYSFNSPKPNIIKDIASGDYSDASIEARSLLELFFNQEYAVEYRVPTDNYSREIGSYNSEQRSQIEVFPNPSNGVYFIESEINISKVEVFGYDGKIIMSSVDIDTNQYDFFLEKSGVYWVKVTLDEGTTLIEKLIRID